MLLAACAIAITAPALAQTAVLDDERPPGTPRSQRAVTRPDPDDDEDAPSRTAPRNADAPAAEVIRPFQPPRNAAWIEPVFPIIGLFSATFITNVGISHSLSRGLDLVVQGGGGAQSQYGSSYAMGGLSIGLTVFLTGTEPMNGLFLSPKVSFNAAYDPRNGRPTDYFGAGIDLGFQYAVGGFYFAPVLGVGWDVGLPQGGTGTTNTPFYATRLNLAGFRIGWTFDGARGSEGERARALRMYAHESHGLDAASDRRPRSVAVWTWPLWMAIGPLFNRYNVGLGVTARVEDRIQIVVEGSYEWGALTNGVTNLQANYSRVDGAVGVAFMLYSSGGLGGLFLEPKIYGNLFVPGVVGGFVPAFAGGFGLDIGYAFTAGPFYIAPVFGVRLGATAVASPGTLNRQQPSGFTPDVNFTLLRMGVGF